MKSIIILLIAFIATLPLAAQTHVPASESIVGIWRQTAIMNNFTGKMIDVKSGNYKVFNSDRTYYTFIIWGKQSITQETTIGQYGNYNITSDSTLIEHIIEHTVNPKMNDSESHIRYELIDENNLIIKWSLDNKTWTSEKWTRLPLSIPNIQKKQPLKKHEQTVTL
ncbi:DUF4488 domain-containing protein [Echinicola marina]|uniref:DUF4488 domain-containing protein n=1 Tax=Echinicola marina TaxID=2859768 RepID=UPI001CF70BA9|nr:DUF4488 domain-containing protein [Echinicola marina]UCS95408.1 DUF4488 domain-containing protein [Echinicola marina]